MNEREYKEIITPVGKKKVKIKAWITGRESRAIKSSILEGVNFSGKQGDEQISSDYVFNAKTLEGMKDKAIEMVVVEIDGNKENILNTVLDMRREDYDFVLTQVDEVTETSDADKKK